MRFKQTYMGLKLTYMDWNWLIWNWNCLKWDLTDSNWTESDMSGSETNSSGSWIYISNHWLKFWSQHVHTKWNYEALKSVKLTFCTKKQYAMSLGILFLLNWIFHSSKEHQNHQPHENTLKGFFMLLTREITVENDVFSPTFFRTWW